MKKKTFFSAAAFAVAIGVTVVACQKDPVTPPTTPADVHLKNGLLLYLPFDGNFADSSGNGNPTALSDGAGNNAGLAPDEHGYSDRAYGCNGSGSTALLVTNNGSIRFDTAYTISANFMTFTPTVTQGLISLTDYTTGYGATFAYGFISPGTNRLTIGSVDSADNRCDWFSKNAAPNVSVSDTTNFTAAAGSWYNVITSYKNGTVKTYVNGTLVSTKSGIGTKTKICPNSKVVIGGWWSTDPMPINGRIDEVRLYNRTLNANEIKELSKDFQY